jgi:hypothetical protein
MATEDILIRYRADVSQLESDINKVIDSQEELTKATKDNTQAQQKAVTASEFAAKKRVQLLEQEKQKLEQIRNTQKTAFDSSTVEKYNNQIAASQKRIDSLGTSYKNAADQAQSGNQQLLGGLTKIAGAFGIAFSAEALIQFGQQAVNSFLAAEETANKLRFAVINIAGESEEALARLEAQAQKVADTTFFGDDDVKAAQAAGLAFGLTADQVERAIPALIEFATVNDTNVQGAMQALGGALQGRAGDFRNFNVEVKATNTQAENLDAVIAGVAKQTGAAGDALKTASGQAKDFKDELGEFTEAVGKGIIEYFQTFYSVIQPVLTSLSQLGNLLINLIPDSLKNRLKDANGELSAFQVILKAAFFPAKVLYETIANLLNILIKLGATVGGVVNVFREGFNQIGETVSTVGAGIADVLNGIADFDTAKIQTGLTKVQGSFSKAGKDIANAFNEGYQNTLDLTKPTEDEALKAAKASSDNLLKSDDLRKKSLTELRALQLQLANDQTNAGKQNLEAVKKIIAEQEKAAEVAAKAAEEAKKQAEEVKKLIDSIDAEITKLSADLAKRKIEIIPAETQQEQIDRIKALADLNEQAITDEIQGKIKLVEEDANLSEKQKADLIAKYEELKAARLALANFNEQNELNIISADQVKRIEAAAKQLDDLNIEQALVVEADKVEAANEAVAKSFEDLGEAISKADFETAKEAATARTNALNQALKNEQAILETSINNNREAELAKVKEGEGAAAEREVINKKADDQILTATKKTNDAIEKNNKELNKNITTNTERSTEDRKAILFEQLQYTQQLFAELSNIYNAFSEKRISDIEKERDAQLESIDAQLEQNAEYLDKRRISEEEAAANEKALQAEKLRIEEQTQKKINQEKRKQAILNKANAIFEIGLNTAIALSNPSNLASFGALSPFIAALGALQIAAVLAQPIPYRKGSKDTGPKGHLARVGEEGEELVFMPSNSKVLPARQTKKYSEIIDAMYDNKLDDYVYKNYITPALMAQKEAKDNQRAKSFADNMASSIVYNQAGLTPSDLEAQRKRGQYIRNVDEIAEAIAKKLPIRDIYRA